MGNAPHKLFYTDDPDLPLSIDKPYYLKLAKNKSDMTGWERVQNLFELDDYGEISPEIMQCKDAMFVSMFCGGAVGAIARSTAAYQDFFRSYAHEKFETPMRAKMLLQEKVLVSLGTGFWRVGWRLGAFTGMFMFGGTLISAYRGNQGIAEQSAGGALAGALYKFREGPKPAIAGGIFGGVLGAVAWCCYSAIFAITGLDYDTLIAYEHQRRALINAKKLSQYHELRNDQGRVHSLQEFQDSLLAEPAEVENDTSSPKTMESEAKNNMARNPEKLKS